MSETASLSPILFAQAVEGRFPVSATEGAVPEGLDGTYYLNGPANLKKGGLRYRHWLDGDGLIRALRFSAGQVEHETRFVRTRKFIDEAKGGRPIYRTFGSAIESGRLRRGIALESPTNVSVYDFAGHLLAFGEQSLPWEIAPDSLETVREFNFNRKLIDISPFSAHPKVDLRQNRLANFGLKYRSDRTTLAYWEFAEDLSCPVERQVDLPHPYSIHDFVLTDHYAIFYLSAYFFDVGSFIQEGRSFHDSLNWDPNRDSELLLIERKNEGRVTRLPLGKRGYCLHLINGFEEGDRVVIDLIETAKPLYPQYCPLPTLFPTVDPSSFVRLRGDVGHGRVEQVDEFKQTCHLDFPTILPEFACSSYRHSWTLAMPTQPRPATNYYDRLFRFDWESMEVVDEYRAPDGIYLSGEPSVVNRDSGHAPILVFPRWHRVENRSDYVLLDPYALSSPPIAVIPLPHPSPLAFHSSYVPATGV